MRAMLERTDAGLDVSVSYDPLTQKPVLICERDGELAVAVVPPEKVFDAFEHPALYFSEEWAPLFNPPRVVVETE